MGSQGVHSKYFLPDLAYPRIADYSIKSNMSTGEPPESLDLGNPGLTPVAAPVIH